MPPRKYEWEDIPNKNCVKDKDENGKWICCKVCNIKIKIRSQFSTTEWKHHCESSNHCCAVRNLENNNNSKMTSFYQPVPQNLNNTFADNWTDGNPRITKRQKITESCPGFAYRKNADLLPLYEKYKKQDDINKSISIVCRDGKWSIHDAKCTQKATKFRKSQCPDKKACEVCFSFPKILLIKERISRMQKILRIEQHLMENHCSDTGYIEISKFLKTNNSDASPSTIFLIGRCKQYLSHHKWMKTNFSHLKKYTW